MRKTNGGAHAFEYSSTALVTPLQLFFNVQPDAWRVDDQRMVGIMIRDRRRIFITGKVQGVAFRAWLQSVANSLELSGEARLLPDGRCEVAIQGERSLVKQFVVACKRGPSGAVVESIEVIEERLDPECFGFQMLK